MENLIFLVLTAILLAIAIFFLLSYVKDRKSIKSMFTKRK
ncbi:small membrane protein [Klebsiella aerogenes]|nr:small membrane protein [Klebsiella aerogenes]EKZ6150918.1 small membrane protein [Klebsiella aerogenes]EKZ6287057.1 small membrane protein [Klebsiella aerogenes]HBW3050400.1 small membrane protein [Klebsiella aerogenes]HCD1880677.1 small membrane protein [Klebsiella aerogenes]HCW3470141.1 small membrane protein [Klebsiella aerogenes]